MNPEPYPGSSIKLGLTHNIGRLSAGMTASTHAFDVSRHVAMEEAGERTNLRDEVAIEIQRVDTATGTFGAIVIRSNSGDLRLERRLTFEPVAGRSNVWR